MTGTPSTLINTEVDTMVEIEEVLDDEDFSEYQTLVDSLDIESKLLDHEAKNMDQDIIWDVKNKVREKLRELRKSRKAVASLEKQIKDIAENPVEHADE